MRVIEQLTRFVRGIELKNTADPDVSPAGSVRLAYDNTNALPMASANGGAYSPVARYATDEWTAARLLVAIQDGAFAADAPTRALFADAIWTAAKLTTTLATGYVPLPLTAAREIATNDFAATAADAGVLSSNTTPILQRVNAATDKKARLNWAAANVDEIAWDFPYPPDLDDTAVVTVNVLAAMAGATDTPLIAVSYFEGVGDTNAGGNTAAVTGTAVAKYSVTIAAADIGAYPKAASIGLVPAAHGTDALYIYGAWAEYTRK